MTARVPDQVSLELIAGVRRLRLNRDASWVQAETVLTRRAKELEQSFPETNKDRGIDLIPLKHARFYPGHRGSVLGVLSFLMAGACVILLTSCFNVGGLLLSRTAYLQRELATRMAVGASRGRIIRQLLTEAVLLSALAAVAGLLLASWIVGLLSWLPHAFEYALDFEARLDFRVFGFLFGLVLISILVFALYPAVVASSKSIVAAIHEGGSGRGTTAGATQLRKVLVVTQIALALAVLTAAGLLARSLSNRLTIGPGFETAGIYLVHLDLLNLKPDLRDPFLLRLIEGVRVLPGVKSVSIARDAPLSQFVMFRQIEQKPPEMPIRVRWTFASVGYFETLGIPLLQGSTFRERTGVESDEVVINQTAASRFWGNEDPIGQQLRIRGENRPFFVVGVVADAKYNDLTEAPIPYFYFSCDGVSMPLGVLLIRAVSDSNSLETELRRIMRELDPELAVSKVTTLEKHLKNRNSNHRFLAVFACSLGLVAIFLVVTGLYGLVSFVVSQRSREIGIRLALGASRGKIFRWILGQGGFLGLLGIAVGVLASLGLTRLLATRLYAVAPNDFFTFLLASLVLMIVALAASYFPARKACSVDPAVTLRTE